MATSHNLKAKNAKQTLAERPEMALSITRASTQKWQSQRGHMCKLPTLLTELLMFQSICIRTLPFLQTRCTLVSAML